MNKTSKQLMTVMCIFMDLMAGAAVYTAAHFYFIGTAGMTIKDAVTGAVTVMVPEPLETAAMALAVLMVLVMAALSDIYLILAYPDRWDYEDEEEEEE